MKSFYSLISLWTLLVVEWTVVLSSQQGKEKDDTHEYMVQIKNEWVDVIKRESPRFGFEYKGKIVSNVFLFKETAPTSGKKETTNGLSNDMNDFKEFFAEKIINVEKREVALVKYYPFQTKRGSLHRTMLGRWILRKHENLTNEKCWPYYGMDVQEAWSLGYTGFNVRVAVVDVGVEANHPDLERNVKEDLSYSFVDSNHSNVWPQRFPNYLELDEIMSHGTMAAGLIAGEFGNNVCSSGIAFDAQLIALKALKYTEDPRRPMPYAPHFQTDYIPAALTYKRDEIDIYSCSFNLDDGFKAASLALKTALKEGVEMGRNGKGSIYVFSAGNNKGSVHDCNMEALANSIYTITISSVGTNGSKPSSAIPCACTLASTYGEFKTYSGSEKLETTTHDKRCSDFDGTSASAALASGILALSLQANPKLTWRDLQHILVLSSSLRRLQSNGRLKQNSFSLQYDPFFGFGLVNATEMIILSKSWKSVPIQTQLVTNKMCMHKNFTHLDFTRSENTFAVILRSDCCDKEKSCVKYLEHVMINIKYRTTEEPLLEIILCSPSKTCSFLLNRETPAKTISSGDVQRDWNFTSVHFWGENPEGHWILLFKENRNRNSSLKSKQHFHFLSAELTLFGTSSTPYQENLKITKKQHPNNSENVTCTSVEWYEAIVCKIHVDLSEAGDTILKCSSNEGDKIPNDSFVDGEQIAQDESTNVSYLWTVIYLVIYCVGVCLILAVLIVWIRAKLMAKMTDRNKVETAEGNTSLLK